MHRYLVPIFALAMFIALAQYAWEKTRPYDVAGLSALSDKALGLGACGEDWLCQLEEGKI